ncbi:MAG: DUF899 domain-containing protein [Caulobacter sp.]|nr:DUF899 domain-containing protein [Caulobacter sp.]
MTNHKVASREEWLEARKALLVHEKEETRLRDRNAAERLALPWVKIDKTYTFDTPAGRKTLDQLFAGRSQLVVYHFMLPPEWETGCPGCSFLVDHLDGALPHLNHHDVTLVAVSRAPLDKIAAYKARMGWKFPWVSSFGGDFNYDFGVSFTPETIAAGATYNFEPAGADSNEAPGLSAFYKDETGQVFHTYSSYGRGGEELIGTYMILDRAPLGRNESGNMGDWMRRHDEYEDAAPAKACHAEAVPA